MPRKSSSKPQRKKAVSFEKRVMAVVQRQAETKQKVITVFSQTNIPGSGLVGVASGLSVQSLSQSLAVAQGVEQEQRQGNEITNCRLRVRGLIESLPYDSTTNPNLFGYEVHMVIFKKKDDPQNSTSSLKSLPGNLTGPCDGTVINTMYPYNKDAYIIKKVKVFRMNPFVSKFPPDSTNTVTAQPNTYLFKRFYADIPVSKKWKYQDTLGSPSNEWTTIAFYVVNSDGSLNTTLSRCQISMDATLTYDDF